MINLLHVSDLHGQWKKGIDRFDGHIIIAGDTLNDGAGYELRWLGKKLEPLAGRITLLKGNHDDSLQGLIYSSVKGKRFDKLSLKIQGHKWESKDPLVQTISGHVDIISLNSCTQTNAWGDLATGIIGDRQLQKLDSILNFKRTKIRILALHHHPFIISESMRLLDVEQLREVVTGRVDVILFGHYHHANRYDGAWGIPFVIAAPPGYMSPWANVITIDDKKKITISKYKML